MADQHAKVIEEIGKDHQLKHVETQDKGAPKIESKLSESFCAHFFS